MSDVKWFKVLTDIFSDDKIKIIQSMPDGDALLIMWFKLMAQAGKTNDGGYIYLKKDMPYTPGMLSTLFNKTQQTVELALKTFSSFDMIDIDDRGYIFLTNWEKHQAIEKMDKIREQTRLRVDKHRQKKKLELESGKTVTEPVTGNVTCNANVTERNATEIEVDIEKEFITTTTSENSKFALNDVYTKVFGTMHMTGAMQEFFFPLLNKGFTETFCIEILLEGAETSSGGKPSIRYLESIRDRWVQEGIYTRLEAKRRRDSKKITHVNEKKTAIDKQREHFEYLKQLQKENENRNEFTDGDAVNL